MKKKMFILLMLPFLLLGCSNEAKNNVNDDNKNIVVEEPVDNPETFSNENYDCYPKVKNIVRYLELSPKEVKVLTHTNKRLVFCLYAKEVDVHDESILSIYNYVKMLEKEGYKMNLYDGAISSTFVLEKENQKVSITTISNIESWKEENKDKEYLKDIENQNIVCEINEMMK